MESPGEYLRRERDLRRVSLQKIHEATRVPMKVLESIEADRYEGLPHATFIKGFIRSYCKVLGVDETDAVLRFELFIKEKEEAEAAASGAKPVKASPAKPVKKKASAQNPAISERLPANLRKHAIVVAGVLIIVAAYAFSIKKDASVDNHVKPPVQAATEVTAAPAPVQTAPEAVTQPAAPAPDAVRPMQAAPLAQPAVQPAQPVNPAVQPVAVPFEKPKAQEPVKKDEAAKPGALLKEEPPVAAKNQTLTASASEMVWIKIGVDGGEPVEVLLRGGESFTWKATEGFSLIVGNAGGVALTYNGKQISNLGLPGEVVSLKLPSGKQQRIRKPQEKPIRDLPQPGTAPAPEEMHNAPGTENNINAKVP